MLFELRQDGTGVVAPHGVMDSDSAAAFRTALLKAFELADNVVLDLSGVESMNMLNLQLCCSAIRTADSAGKHITFGERPCPALDRAAEEAGLKNIEQRG